MWAIPMNTPPDNQNTPRLWRRKTRDLTQAIMLRPREVYMLYGLSSSTICELCQHPDPDKRIPSTKVPGRRGHKGMRLINHAELKVWLAKWRSAATEKAA
jgi:hypothetical protein